MLGGVDVWAKGDYPTVARHLLPISVDLVEAAGVAAGERVLDVGTGDGNAAVLCARRGASVVGVDLTPVQIERARARCEAEGVEVDLRVGDAQALDLPDAGFDLVLSVMAVIFAPDADRAMGELARVVRPGGRIALTAWSVGGWSEAWRDRIADLLGSAPQRPAAGWQTPADVTARFATAGLDVDIQERTFAWCFPSEEEAVETFLSASPPHAAAMEQAEALGKAAELRALLADVVAASNAATDGTCALPGPYLLAMSGVPGPGR